MRWVTASAAPTESVLHLMAPGQLRAMTLPNYQDDPPVFSPQYDKDGTSTPRTHLGSCVFPLYTGQGDYRPVYLSLVDCGSSPARMPERPPPGMLSIPRVSRYELMARILMPDTYVTLKIQKSLSFSRIHHPYSFRSSYGLKSSRTWKPRTSQAWHACAAHCEQKLTIFSIALCRSRATRLYSSIALSRPLRAMPLSSATSRSSSTKSWIPISLNVLHKH